ncbi:MAG: OsmC family protein [Solirubrobacterales bacterium]
MRNALARRRQGFETEVEIRGHRLIVDEPTDAGGKDAGPRPTELLAASLASCTTITIVMYADRKGWDVGAVETAVDFTEPSADDDPSFEVKIRIPAELSDEQRERILVIASKCPVHKTLAAQDVKIEDSIEIMEA